MNIETYIIETDLTSGYDPAFSHDYDFQCFDDIVQEELGYSVAESPNTKWKKLQKFPWRFERISDKKKAWTNRIGFDELVKTKRFKFLGFDATLATSQQKQQWKELSALLAKLKPAPKPPPTAPKPAPTTTTQPFGGNARWKKTSKFPWVFRRISDSKQIWANRPGFDAIVKTKKYKFLKFNAELATSQQKQQWKELSALLAKLKPAPKPPPVALKPPPTAPKPPPTAPKPPPVAPKTTPLALPHPDSRWLGQQGYPFAFARISDQKGVHTGKAGFDALVKTGQWKFIKFKPEFATPLQKQQWSEISQALARLAPKPPPVSKPLPIPPRQLAVEPKGMAGDILDIKKMLQYAELQRQATTEHEEIAATKEFRRQVLDRLMQIADAVLQSDSNLYHRIRNAYVRG